MIDNPALKNRDINISKKEFGEIKKVVKKNTFIETVNSIRYDDFLIASTAGICYNKTVFYFVVK